MKKSLTFQYTFHQMAYWATAAGVIMAVAGTAVFFLTVEKKDI